MDVSTPAAPLIPTTSRVLPADDVDQITAWLRGHGLTTSAGPGAVLNAMRSDLEQAR